VSAQFKNNGADSKVLVSPPSPQPQAAPSTAAGKQQLGKAVMKAIDGNEATAGIAYAFNDVSFIYPITPGVCCCLLFVSVCGCRW
jgi:hypothetical protein